MIRAIKNRLGRTSLRNTELWRHLKIRHNDALARAELVHMSMRAGGCEKARLRILVIDHFFSGELESLGRVVSGDPSIHIESITPEPFFSRALVMFPEAVHCAGIPYDDPSLENIRGRYRTYCSELFAAIQKAYPFNCVVTPSDSFYWLREFLGVCSERQVPTVVADKEGMISPRSFAVEPYRIARMFPPMADHFLVWSERQAQFWRNAGMWPERIRVIGSARSDLFVNLRQNLSANKVLIFDFDDDAYINNLDWKSVGWQGERTWRSFREELYRSIAAVAGDFPDVEFVLKCHPQQVHTDFPDVGFHLLGNVSVLRGAPRGIPGLVADSLAVVGFQTTALAEAALTPVPVFYAAWGELYDAVASQILPWNEPGFGLERCTSAADLTKKLRQAVLRTYECGLNDRSRLDRFFFNADGQVARRLLDALIEITCGSLVC